MTYTTCVSIAEKTPGMLRRRLSSALKKSRYAELRLDALPPSRIPDALELADPDIGHTICTVRSKSQGGFFSGPEQHRIDLLKTVIGHRPYLVDIELDAISANPGLVNMARRAGTRILVSWHDFKKTPATRTLVKKFEQMKQFSNHVKLVTTANSISDASRILSLYSKSDRTRLVAFAMGDPGRISRILCLYMGSPFTYVSLGKPVAPGQFSIDQVLRLKGIASR